MPINAEYRVNREHGYERWMCWYNLKHQFFYEATLLRPLQEPPLITFNPLPCRNDFAVPLLIPL